MLAKVQGLFRLTRDCELKYLQNGSPVAKIGLACSEKFGDKEAQLFIDGTVWGKQAEIINQYAGSKGTQIYIVGKLQTDTWEKDGQKHSKVSLIVEGFDFVGNKQQVQQAQPQQNHTAYREPQPMPQQQNNQLPMLDVDEDTIPF